MRSVADLLHERGIGVSRETVRGWWNIFGPMFAAGIQRKRANCMRGTTYWRWRLDEVFVKINGVTRCLWRAASDDFYAMLDETPMAR